MTIFTFIERISIYNRIRLLPRLLKEGLKWRIPGCCVLFFLVDHLMDRPAGVYRGERHNRYTVYAPCPFHMDNNFKPERYLMNGKVCYPQRPRITIYRAPVV